jgi:hypothetical protein
LTAKPLSPSPVQADWAFDFIRQSDVARADRLEQVNCFGQVTQEIVAAITLAHSQGKLRIGTDTPGDGRQGERAIVQFPVGPYLLDAFFNSRGGFRAEYWRGVDVGQCSEAHLISGLMTAFKDAPKSIEVRQIQMALDDWGQRVEQDVGAKFVALEFLTAALGSSLAKVYICERLIQNKKGSLLDLRPGLYNDAMPLLIPRWRTARAANCTDEGWLDWKGAFLFGGGEFQIKPREIRAADLNKYGST